MRLPLILLALAALAGLGAAVYVRVAPMPADRWHVDPATVTPPASPNFALLVGASAPVFDVAPDVLAARIDAVATAERAELIGGALAEGHMTYVVRSRLMGFPDAVSIRLTPVSGGTRMEIYARARFGYSDLGVNAARVARWIETVRGMSGP